LAEPTPPPGRNRRLVSFALALGSFLAALEATAVAASVPTAVGELRGMSHYSWVFSAYLLTSTTTVPLYGKLADLYGRRRVYHFAVALFLLGSVLCGFSNSLGQLIVCRAIQGLGAGGVQPITMTLIGDLYTLKERGRIQGLFSGVWAFSSLIGPPLGGLITDLLSWRWIFFINIPFGIASSLILQRWLGPERAAPRKKHRLDVLGTALLTLAITVLLIGLLEGAGDAGFTAPLTLGLFATAIAGLVAFVFQERRAAEPMLPLDLLAHPVIGVSAVGNVLIGVLLYAITAFVPMFSQGVIGGSAAAAGAVLTPMLLGWPIASVISGRLVLRAGYRPLAIVGGGLIAVGGVLLTRLGAGSSREEILIATFVIGLGLGFFAMPLLLAVQNAVGWQQRGVATSSVQFFRTIGGAVAVAALGALLNARVAAHGSHLDPNAVFEPALLARLPPTALHALQAALVDGLRAVFMAIGAMAVLTLVVALLFPKASIAPATDAPVEPLAGGAH
jgi:EmrB/QacA subfamily drug resistance transporter